MVLHGYFDDSFDEEYFVLAGYVASVERWAKFSKAWEDLLPLAVKHKDHHRFKMSEMARFGKMEQVLPFYKTIMEHVSLSVSSVLDIKALNRVNSDMSATIISANGHEIRVDLKNFKKVWADPFYVSFRGIIDGFHELRLTDPDLVPLQEPVDFYFDEWGKKEIIRQSWRDHVASRHDDIRPFYGKEPRFEDDNEFLPIQAADFLAWWVRKWAKEFGQENIKEGVFPFDSSPRKIEHLVIRYSEDGLRALVKAALDSHLQAVDRAMAEGSNEVRFIPNLPWQK